jgi:sterol 3beta-glucosyltransferase
VQALGVGPAPIPNKKLTTEALVAAIKAATTDMRMCDSAARIGALLQAEDGVGKAIAFMERMGVLS